MQLRDMFFRDQSRWFWIVLVGQLFLLEGLLAVDVPVDKALLGVALATVIFAIPQPTPTIMCAAFSAYAGSRIALAWMSNTHKADGLGAAGIIAGLVVWLTLKEVPFRTQRNARYLAAFQLFEVVTPAVVLVLFINIGRVWAWGTAIIFIFVQVYIANRLDRLK